MTAEQFAYAIHRLAKAYRVRDKSFELRGLPNLRICADQFIGDVRLVGEEIMWVREPAIAAARDIEFKRPKYKKMPSEQVEFLKALFELSALTKL